MYTFDNEHSLRVRTTRYLARGTTTFWTPSMATLGRARRRSAADLTDQVLQVSFDRFAWYVWREVSLGRRDIALYVRRTPCRLLTDAQCRRLQFSRPSIANQVDPRKSRYSGWALQVLVWEKLAGVMEAALIDLDAWRTKFDGYALPSTHKGLMGCFIDALSAVGPGELVAAFVPGDVAEVTDRGGSEERARARSPFDLISLATLVRSRPVWN